MNKVKSIKIVLSALFFLCLISVKAFADKGVFQAKITPDETFTDTASTMTISAEIGAENLYISSVKAYQTTADGKPIKELGLMYDDGTHGDEREADTIFTTQFTVNEPAKTKLYVRVTAAYRGDRNRYLSPVMEINIYEPIPAGESEEVTRKIKTLEQNWYSYIATMDLPTAAQRILQDALADPAIARAGLSNNVTLWIEFKNGMRGIVQIYDQNNPTREGGSAVPTNLPNDAKFPGNDKLLIFASSYGTGWLPWELHFDADDAKNYFDNSVYMEFSPNPPIITKNSAANLDVVKTWGNYGTVIVDGHGGFWDSEVVIQTGTEVNGANKTKYALDICAGRIGESGSGRYVFYPSYIKKHCASMKNTFFWLGVCDGLKNDTLWNELHDKGAKVAFGWSGSVGNGFANGRCEEVLENMLPDDEHTDPKTAKEAYDAVPDKVDDGFWIFGWWTSGATLTLKTARPEPEWEKFVFAEGGIINGGFEAGDWTGWEHGGDYNYRLISGARKYTANYSVALGRWDTAYHGHDPTSEPYGYEWFYQDFVVPNNVTYLKFVWWMETYDTAVWDWFDASL